VTGDQRRDGSVWWWLCKKSSIAAVATQQRNAMQAALTNLLTET